VNIRRFFPGTGVIIAFIVVLVVAVTGNIQTNDQILLPLKAEAITGNVLSIAGHPPHPNRGTFYFTFVREEQANLLTKYYYQYFDPDATILPNEAIYGTSNPTPQKQQQVQQQNVVDMIDSKKAAEVAAFTALGYQSVVTEKITVTGIITGSKALGVLQQGDVIVAENHQTIRTEQQLVSITQSVRPGEAVSLAVRRTKGENTRLLHVTIPTMRNPQTGKASIGIYLGAVVDANPPYNVTLNTNDVEGPSAGLMFTLSIINRLSKTDITHGQKIAGTGTIDINGNVGPIGGVKQKVIGARQAGAKYFFVPAYCDQSVCNYKEAKPYAKGITLLPVNTLDDALNDLKRLK
jgi:PDZ domain-containing protein